MTPDNEEKSCITSGSIVVTLRHASILRAEVPTMRMCISGQTRRSQSIKIRPGFAARTDISLSPNGTSENCKRTHIREDEAP